MHDVACEFARAAVRSKDAQKQSARTSLSNLVPRSLVCTRDLGTRLVLKLSGLKDLRPAVSEPLPRSEVHCMQSVICSLQMSDTGVIIWLQ